MILAEPGVGRPFQGRRVGPKRPALQLTVLAFLALAARVSAAPLTYTKDIAPLVNDRCAMCHHPNGAAPFSLLTYDDVKRRATQIGEVTKRRFMPPWKADPDNGPFVGQHPLTDAEIATIRRWVDEGAVEGEVRLKSDATSDHAAGWQIGRASCRERV